MEIVNRVICLNLSVLLDCYHLWIVIFSSCVVAFAFSIAQEIVHLGGVIIVFNVFFSTDSIWKLHSSWVENYDYNEFYFIFVIVVDGWFSPVKLEQISRTVSPSQVYVRTEKKRLTRRVLSSAELSDFSEHYAVVFDEFIYCRFKKKSNQIEFTLIPT